MLIHTGKKFSSFMSLVFVLAFACTKPAQLGPVPTLTSSPEPEPEIMVASGSQQVFTNGISFNSEEPPSNVGSGGVSLEPQPQVQTVNFTAPAAWSASVEATKAVDWLAVEPSSGAAGSVEMKVTAQPNLTHEERAATVTIKSGGVTASFTVRQACVPRPVEVTGVTLDQTALTLTAGESATLVATVSPENATDKSVSWSSSNAVVASVDESGKVKAVSAGEAVITAKAGEKTAECKVTVNTAPAPEPPTPEPPTLEPPAPECPAPESPAPETSIPVSSITLDKTELELKVGESATLTATVGPADATDKTVNWSSSDSAIVSVDDSGKVTALALGEAVITAQSGSLSVACTVKVLVPTGSVEGTGTTYETPYFDSFFTI